MENEMNENEGNQIFSEVNTVLPKKTKSRQTLHKIIFTILSISIFVTAWIIGEKIKDYGLHIALIRSVGGKTLEEAYYASVGEIYMLLADFIKVLIAGISGIILCITYK